MLSEDADIVLNPDRLIRFVSRVDQGMTLGLAAFDAETTLTDLEGLDFKGEQRGLGTQVRAVTNQGMGGSVSFRESLSRRLDVLGLSPADLKDLAPQYIDKIFPGAQTAVSWVRARARQTVIISGGFTEPLLPMASELGFEPQDVHALTLGPDGRVQENSILDSKRNRFRELLIDGTYKENQIHLMVGDGMTDAAVASDDTLFVGVGSRPQVIESADIVIPTVALLPKAIQMARTWFISQPS